ncbi:MAG: metallophosphoesterase [Lachnoclostridium sp.]|nr:metallophosphoesterase [Lachnoclostridium sp.]
MFSIFRYLIYFAVIYTMVRHRNLWKCTKLPMVIYWIIQILFFANYYTIAFGRSSIYSNETVFTVMSVIAGIYFMYFLYAGYITLVFDLIAKVILRKKGGRILTFMRNPARGLLFILCFTLLLGVAGVFGIRSKRFVDYEITVDKKTELNQLKIAAIADAHMGTGVTRKGITRIVEKINEANVDVVILDGDFFDHSSTESLKKHAASELAKLKSTYGTYFIKGNHERYLEGEEYPEDYFRDAGIPVLLDDVVEIADGITIIGRRDFSDNPLPLNLLMKEVDQTRPVIVVQHRPIEYDEVLAAGADLVICGHTHGGQYPFGNIGTGSVNDQNYGLMKNGSFHAVTTSGIGGWGVPIKLPYISEIVLITINFANQL